MKYKTTYNINNTIDPASYLKGWLVYVQMQKNLNFQPCGLNKGEPFSAESTIIKTCGTVKWYV